MENNTLESINARFNEQLERQKSEKDGKVPLPIGHIYKLGMPGDILLSTGFPKMPMELSSTLLKNHANLERHPFDILEIKNLVVALQHPVAVFRYGNPAKAQNVILEIQQDGKNFLVGVHFHQTLRGSEISDIRSVFPKPNQEWLNWIAQGKLLYVDKEKIQALIDKRRMNPAEVGYLDLDFVTKIVKKFENPNIEPLSLSEKTSLKQSRPKKNHGFQL